MTDAVNTDVLQVAYLTGTSYCGSTLMALLMDCHPQIVSVGETSIGLSDKAEFPCSCGTILIDCPFWQLIFHEVNQLGFELNALNWVNNYDYRNPLLNKILVSFPSHRVMRVFHQVVASNLPIHRTRIKQIHRANVAFIHAALKLTEAKVFFDTSKRLARLNYLLKIPELDIQVIRVVRDVRAFANSSKRNSGRSVEEAAMHWKKHQLAADDLLRKISSPKVFLLRYEDLCQDSKHWLQNLHNFLGVKVLEPPKTIFPQEHHVIGNRMRLKEVLTVRLDESWKTELTKEEVSLILRIAGEVNESFGYS